MNVSRLLRETAILEQLVSSNDYTGDVFAPPESIRVRWSFENKLVRNNSGEEVTVNAHISTLVALAVGDRVTDPTGVARRVITVRPNRDVHGRYSHTVGSLA